MPELKGLPEGVEAVELARSTPYTFYWDTKICFGNTGAPVLIVQPKPGFTFRYDIMRDGFDVVQKLATPKRITAVFIVDTEIEIKQLDAFRGVKGFVSLKEESLQQTP